MSVRDWSKLKWFVPREFRHPEEISWKLLCMIDKLREELGFPLIPTSDFRPNDPGAHGRGLALDIRAHGSITRRQIVEKAIEMRFPRIGVYDKHVHLDIDESLPWGIWGGKSE